MNGRNHVAAWGAALCLACQPASAADPAEGHALAAFLTHLSTLNTARVCAPSIPGYQARFDAAYGRWKQRHAALITQGERLVVEGSQQPGRVQPKLRQILEVRDRLARPAEPASAPASAPTPRQREWCESVFNDLKSD